MEKKIYKINVEGTFKKIKYIKKNAHKIIFNKNKCVTIFIRYLKQMYN